MASISCPVREGGHGRGGVGTDGGCTLVASGAGGVGLAAALHPVPPFTSEERENKKERQYGHILRETVVGPSSVRFHS